MKTIRFIIPYFGKFPGWFPFFLKSCEFNKDISWLILTDQTTRDIDVPDNVEVKPFSLKEFNNLASQKLGLDISIKNSYKICDFRPAFGAIFSEYLKNIDFWGYTDVDVIYGNIRHFVNNDLLEKYEIISTCEHFLHGSFTLYKNTEKINQLYLENPDYKRVFTSTKHFSFDERGNIWDNGQYWEGHIGNEDFIDVENQIKSMDDTVKKATREGQISSFFKNLSFEPEILPWNSIEKSITWKNGILTKQGVQGLYVHFQNVKNLKEFKIDKNTLKRSEFFISRYGVSVKQKNKVFPRILNVKIKDFIIRLKKIFLIKL